METERKKRSDVARFAPATVAKIRVIHGRQLKAEDYAELMACRTVNEAAAYLKTSTHFCDALSAVDTNTAHRGMIEDVLRKSVFYEYMRITDFERLNKQDFYNFCIIREEIAELLRCIRYLNADDKNSVKYIQNLPLYINKYTSFDMLGLAQLRSFGELVEYLDKTPYKPIMKKLCPPKGEKADFTKCEIALRTYYYSRLFETARYFDEKTTEKLYELFGVQVDMTNIINGYRMTAYFHEEGKTIESLMLPFGKTAAKKMFDLYDAADAADFMARLGRTYYGRLMHENGFDAYDLETAAQKLRYMYARKALSDSQEAPVVVYAFEYLLQNEVSNIIRVIESVRYGVPASETERILVI